MVMVALIMVVRRVMVGVVVMTGMMGVGIDGDDDYDDDDSDGDEGVGEGDEDYGDGDCDAGDGEADLAAGVSAGYHSVRLGRRVWRGLGRAVVVP